MLLQLVYQFLLSMLDWGIRERNVIALWAILLVFAWVIIWKQSRTKE